MESLKAEPRRGAPKAARMIVFGFLALVPFLYALQVILWRNDFVPLPYLAVVLAFGVSLWVEQRGERVPYDCRALLFDEMLLFFLIMNLGWVGFEAVTNGLLPGVRTFIYFVVPPLLAFFLPRFMSERDDHAIMVLAAVAAIIVAAESLTERYANLFLFEPAAFQERNFRYVATLGSGSELQQLLDPGYRAPGLMEHLHATGTFIALGVLLWLFLVVNRPGVGRILGLLFCSFALVVSGARTALVAVVIGGGLALWLDVTNSPGGARRILKYLAVLLFALGLFLPLAFVFEPLRAIYVPLLEARMQDRSFFFYVIPNEMGIWIDTLRRVPISAVFGLGPGSESWRNELGASSDDFFVVDILARYGILGAMLFYGLLAVFLRETWAALKSKGSRLSEDDRRTLVFCLGICVLLYLTTIHSGALVRKGVYPWLFVFLGMGRRRFPGVYAAGIKRPREGP